MTQKPFTLILDGDGVLLDFSTYLLQSVRSDRTIEHMTAWDIFKLIHTWHDQQRRELALELCHDAEWWRMQPPMPGAVQGLLEIRARFPQWRMAVATSPWASCQNWAIARWEALERHFDIPRQAVQIGEDKTLIHGDVFVDDKPEHLEAWIGSRPPRLAAVPFGTTHRALCYAAAYNEGGLMERFTWNDPEPLYAALREIERCRK